jgi:isopenicillin-N epimerase
MNSEYSYTDVLGQRELFWLQPGVVFLNHGSFGACPREVLQAAQEWQRELERQPVLFFQRRAQELLREARETLGAYVGADADEIVYTTNVTMAENIVAQSLDLEPGDEVLTTDQEYGAIDNAWRFVCERRGVRYVQQEIPLPATSSEVIADAIWSGVTERTRVLSISHITSGTALILPVEELARRAREAGIITVVDGAHAPGQIPLDLTRMGVDFYAGNCHKWMMAPKGSGFLYARPEKQDMLKPLVISFGRHPNQDGRSSFTDEQQRQGTRDLSAFLAVPTAIRFAEAHDWPRVRQACHALLCDARQQIVELTGIAGLTPDSADWFAQMAVAPIPPCDSAALHRRLYDEYAIELPVTRWKDQPLLRISVQGYNSIADIEALLNAVRRLLPEMAMG